MLVKVEVFESLQRNPSRLFYTIGGKKFQLIIHGVPKSWFRGLNSKVIAKLYQVVLYSITHLSTGRSQCRHIYFYKE